jgi:hypothetical protein
MAGAQSDTAKKSYKYDFKPLMLDSKNAGGSTIGVDYSISQEKPLKTFGGDGASDSIDPNAVVMQLTYSWSAKGTATAVPERNPRNFLEFALDGMFLWSGSAGTLRIGPDVKFESDQAFKTRQTVIGGAVAWGKMGMLGTNSFIGLAAGYGQVDPKGDSLRAKALGKKAASFGRWNLEGLYMLPVTLGPVRALEVNARLFVEPDAPASIQSAELDQYQVLSVRLALEKDFFVGYSTGKLPFDRKDDKVMAIGWTYKLK